MAQAPVRGITAVRPVRTPAGERPVAFRFDPRAGKRPGQDLQGRVPAAAVRREARGVPVPVCPSRTRQQAAMTR
ncbi:MAG: hypothetical protein ACLFQF_01240 [Rhodosalinus sp.]